MGRWLVSLAVGALIAALPAHAQDGEVGTSFPPAFPEIIDHSLGTPLIGYGAAGPHARTPVVIVHGNNDTPYPTTCNGSYGFTHNLAKSMHARGYALSEIWGVGYQGEQCDILTNPTLRSAEGHTVAANVPDIRAFMNAFFAFTGAERVDVVAHSLGSPLVLEWLRQDGAYARVRRFVGIDGTNHGIINCSPSPQNYYALPATGGFTPDSALCQEVGSIRTPLYASLFASGDETPGPTEYLTIVNDDKSFVYIAAQDGPFPPVPEQDREGKAHSFARSALLAGARNVGLVEQDDHGGSTGPTGLATAHNGIANSPSTFAITYAFLDAPEPAAAAQLPAPAVEPARLVPHGLSIVARARNARGGRLRLTVRGRLSHDPAVAPADACDGSVLIRVRARRQTRSARLRSLRPDCSYAATVTFASRRALGRSLDVVARFNGNRALRPLASRRLRLSPA